RDMGFFSADPVDINGHKIRPVDMSAKLLFPAWKLKPGEEEFTVMKVDVSGKENGKKVTWTYFLHDKFDAKTRFTSMARTTGFTCTAAVHLLLNGRYRKEGICPPEYLGKKTENFEFILDYLQQRNVSYKISRVEK
ncbi:MAG: saccharopine dehydrogenase, partial [Cyclobacteriaceae bacterium]|nr:saccharopine dehydrogenase [Cyclobacteriaceae bacterium]